MYSFPQSESVNLPLKLMSIHIWMRSWSRSIENIHMCFYNENAHKVRWTFILVIAIGSWLSLGKDINVPLIEEKSINDYYILLVNTPSIIFASCHQRTFAGDSWLSLANFHWLQQNVKSHFLSSGAVWSGPTLFATLSASFWNITTV